MSSSFTSVVESGDWAGEPCCAFCKIPKVLAESRLHVGWSKKRSSWGSLSERLDDIQNGAASGCNFCTLVLDAFTAQNLVDVVNAAQKFVLFIDIDTWEGKCKLALSYFDNKDLLREDDAVFPTEGSESGWNLIPMRHPSGDTSSTQAATTIKRWIKACQHGHEACRGQPRTFKMPQRILRLTEEHVQLCENVASTYPYACLSHCWGDAGPSLKLTSANIQSMEAGVLVQRLPKTFRDAVEVCLNIGIHFLWVDALCIIQGDEEDWHTAAASMADIYAGATVTLAATWSDSSDRGCFSQMQDKYKPKPLQEPGLYVRPVAPVFPHISQGYSARNYSNLWPWPLLTRAWVFQERRLSARMVHFGKEQLYWECDSALMSEDGREDTREYLVPTLRSIVPDPVEAWRSVVTQYSALKLTYESDRLPAISALVKRMQPLRKGDTYAAGMWLDSLLEDLSWFPNDNHARRPDENRPTWSWISVLGGCFWSVVAVLESTTLVRTDFQMTGPSHFGSTTNASITLQGASCQAKILDSIDSNEPEFKPELLELPERYHDIQIFVSGYRDFDWASEEPLIQPGEVLIFLLLYENINFGSIIGLVLRDIGHEQYRRVGLVHFNTSFYKHMTDLRNRYIASLPIKEFTIV
ncbi:heterokaryon incompatibility protein-domain-containing protein [Boeremia exigua]|uniref:heterokaryon incompatibility protein-domain-containing protein n=1 Tax=Boeremia exigua TaxID=749465 RepID=UPI001E8DD119|nr:heterokaryon incompatibility protein-domain-containing protein [Boeremia exigua]KAH6629280.1 heterokaryon incompatibility protein-domain-containing protein [Boeremia exigua]